MRCVNCGSPVAPYEWYGPGTCSAECERDLAGDGNQVPDDSPYAAADATVCLEEDEE